MLKILRLGALALALAACGAPRPRPPAVESTPAQTLPDQAGAYRIDAAQSELRVLVYRAGPLARLGHNHVMVNRSLRGAVALSPSLLASSFALVAPAAGFRVDDPEARHEEGAEFLSDISDEAQAGTLNNMLSPEVLNAAAFPDISVKSVAVQFSGSGSPAFGTTGEGAKTLRGRLLVTVSLNVAGHSSTLDVPVTVLVDSGRVVATGVVEVRQSSLGLTPYSLMLGALQVQDAVTLKFRIVASEG